MVLWCYRKWDDGAVAAQMELRAENFVILRLAIQKPCLDPLQKKNPEALFCVS